MVKPAEVYRIYKIPDNEMLQTSRVFLGLYEQDLVLFSQLDPDFNSSFSLRWKAAIEIGENSVRDLTVTDELTQLTNHVNTEMENCRTHFQKMKYYIEKAFPDDKNSWNLFGYDEYDSARRSEVKMIPFMKSLHTHAVKYKEKLLAVNFKQEDIDLILTLWERLLTADQAQESFKKERPITTQNRITALNTVWEFVLQVNRASKIIFADNFAKLQQYVVNDEAPSGNKQTPELAEPA